MTHLKGGSGGCGILWGMAVRKVVQLGHAALTGENPAVENVMAPEIQKTIKDLKDTMYKTGLVGIAATQIGVNYPIFVTHPRTTKARKVGKEDNCRVYINPTITRLSKETVRIYEGCGSVAQGTLFGPVVRAKELTVEAIDEQGQRFALTCDGLLARIIQHEDDHLHGIPFIQKVEDYTKLLAKMYYVKRIRNSKAQQQAAKITMVNYAKI